MRKRESPTKPISAVVTVPDLSQNRSIRNSLTSKHEDAIKPSRGSFVGPLNVVIGFVIGILIRLSWRQVFVEVSYHCPGPPNK
jgi:hypothetical protein